MDFVGVPSTDLILDTVLETHSLELGLLVGIIIAVLHVRSHRLLGDLLLVVMVLTAFGVVPADGAATRVIHTKPWYFLSGVTFFVVLETVFAAYSPGITMGYQWRTGDETR